MEPYERFHIYKGKGSKKSCNIVTTYVAGWTGNFIFIFFHGPKSSKSAKNFVVVGGRGGVGPY